MFDAARRRLAGALACFQRPGQRRQRTGRLVLPPGFVLPGCDKDMSPRSADSQSAGGRGSVTSGSGAKSVRFLVPADQVTGGSGSANYCVVSPLDSPRPRRRGKMKRRKKKKAAAPTPVPVSVASLASGHTGGGRRLAKSMLPGLLTKKRGGGGGGGAGARDSGSESDAGGSDSDSGSGSGSGGGSGRGRSRTVRGRAQTPGTSASSTRRSTRMRQLKPARSAPNLAAARFDSDSESGSDSGGGAGAGRGGKRGRGVGPSSSSALRRSRSSHNISGSGSGGGSGCDDDDIVSELFTTASLKSRRAKRLGTRNGSPSPASARRTVTTGTSRSRMYLPGQGR